MRIPVILVSPTTLIVLGGLFALLGIIFTLRLRSAIRLGPAPDRVAGPPTRLLVVLGSGGHTAELLSCLQFLPTSRYTHRTYLVSSGDDFSASKAAAFEETLSRLSELRRKPYGSYDVAIVPRARRVHQGLLTTPWSCVRCWLACVRVLASLPEEYGVQWQKYVSQRSAGSSRRLAERDVVRLGVTPFPDLILTNGPATGLVTVCAAIFLRFLGMGRPRDADGGGGMRCVYVESWARVKGLSLTGKILVGTGACQKVLVQWQSLKDRIGKGVEYIGPVVK